MDPFLDEHRCQRPVAGDLDHWIREVIPGVEADPREVASEAPEARLAAGPCDLTVLYGGEVVREEGHHLRGIAVEMSLALQPLKLQQFIDHGRMLTRARPGGCF